MTGTRAGTKAAVAYFNAAMQPQTRSGGFAEGKNILLQVRIKSRFL